MDGLRQWNAGVPLVQDHKRIYGIKYRPEELFCKPESLKHSHQLPSYLSEEFNRNFLAHRCVDNLLQHGEQAC